MPTYTPLQSIQLTATATSVIFSGIPQIYQDVILVCSITPSDTQAPALLCEVNSDTGSNYSGTFLYGDGSAAGSNRVSSQTRFTLARQYALGDSTTGQPNFISQFQNYSNTTTHKTVITRSNTPSGTSYKGVEASVGLWRSTSAITTIKVFVSAGGFAAGSTFDLYGISPVAANNAQAAGGTDIFYDASYVYHVFKGSGTFTPYRNLTADILTIAGGGGGDRAGGGAGGLLYSTSQSLTNGTAYSIAIGAGGVGATGSVGTNGGNSSVSGSGFTTLTATGGGRAASSQASTNTGASGGSGGGNEWQATGAGGTGTSGQGNAGGSGSGGTPGVNEATAGGGGAGAVGGNGSTSTGGGAGGAGLSTYSTWASATSTGANSGYYAGGGGAWGRNGVGTGGSGGGGSATSATGVSGATNTGGGGGGGIATNLQGGQGGSGLVIIRYAR